MCLPKEHGWLGVKDIPSFNVSLLGKWKWDLLLNQGEIWARVLEAKYGGWRSLDGPSRVSSESLWWRDLKSIYHHPQLGQQLNKSILWKVGCGDKFKFWEDKWSGGENNLAVKFPRLYTISAQQQHLIQQVGAFNEGGWEWNFQWRRPLFDSEIDMAVAFLQEVEGFRLRSDEQDRWLWAVEPCGSYSAKSAYKAIREDILGAGQVGQFKELWKLRVPAKVTMFVWRLIQDKLPTRDNLKKKWVELQEYLCPFCRLVDESASHLFFHCSNISPLW